MRKTRKLLSVILSAAMVATAFPVAALAGQSGSINGDGTFVGDLVYSIVVPTDLSFTVNPLGYDYNTGNGTSNSSIISTGYGFVNKSSVPVELDVKFNFASPDGITIVDDISAIQDSSDEDPTLYMDIEPATNEPTYAVTSDAQYVSFDGVTFVSGPAITQAEKTIRFKMHKANYKLDNENNTVYVDNSNPGDTVGFRFGGKASMYSDWKGKNIKVNATYGINAISIADYDNTLNVTSGTGHNVLNTALVNVSFDPSGPAATLTNAGRFGITELPDGWRAIGLYCMYNTDNMSVTKAQIIEAVTNRIDNPVGLTIGGETVARLGDNDYTWDPDTATGELSASAKSTLSGQNFLWFTIITDNTDKQIVVSDIVKMQ